MRKNPVVWALILVVRGLIAIVRSSPRNWGRILLNIPDLIFNTNIDHNCPVLLAHLGHMGPEGVRNRKKHPSFLFMPNFHKLQEDSKNVSLKIGS